MLSLPSGLREEKQQQILKFQTYSSGDIMIILLVCTDINFTIVTENFSENLLMHVLRRIQYY